mmetsp:Transcript_20644/g.48790  ORF Transcript_20644/g.48790 Transcript_20644/m.48790 type:complete len:421 (+) Transcript_20644:135-1397(+)
MLVAKSLHLLLAHTRKGKHTDLLGNVRPIAGRSQLLQLAAETSAHRIDPAGHALAFLDEFLRELIVLQNGRYDPGSVARRVGIGGPDVHLELTLDSLGLLYGVGHDGQGADALTVQTKVLAEGLDQGKVVALLHEQPERSGILPRITAGKALIGTVEKGKETAFLDGIRYLLPLLDRRVHASWVMGADMQKDAGPLRHLLDVGDQIGKVQLAVVKVIVRVLLHLQPGIAKDGDVVAPRRIRDVNLGMAKLLEDLAHDAEAAGARQRLDAGDPPLVQRLAIRPVDEFQGVVDKVDASRDAGILVIELAGLQDGLGLPDAGQHERHALVAPVGADADVDLHGEIVLFVGLSKADDRIRRGHGKFRPGAALVRIGSCRGEVAAITICRWCNCTAFGKRYGGGVGAAGGGDPLRRCHGGSGRHG